MTRNEIRRNETTPVVYLLTVGEKNGTEKMMNDKTKLVKEAKNEKASRCCWSAYQKKAEWD